LCAASTRKHLTLTHSLSRLKAGKEGINRRETDLSISLKY